MSDRKRPKDARFTPARPGQAVRGEALAFAASGGEDLDRLDALFRAIEWEANAAEGHGG